jgi:AraC-like DNA-binding protein
MDGSPATRTLPLTSHARLRTVDVDEAREAVSQAFCPHALIPLDGARTLDARFHSVQLGRIGLHYLDYGASVRIAPRELKDFYLVQIPLAGHAEITSGRMRIESDRHRASVPAPDKPLTMDWMQGNPQLIVWIDRPHLEDHLRKMLGKSLSEPIRFDLGMDMTDPSIRSWRKVVDLLVGEVDGGGVIPTEPLAMRQLEQLLLTQFLLGQPNNYSAALHRAPLSPAPKVIRHAAELIEEHACEPLTVEDIAEAVGLSVRAMQDGFRKFLGTTPTQHLRDVRLERVHAELAEADPAITTVTDVAVRWGLLHPGRFSVQYRERFGESPSATLRR